jgi:serine/threonine protein kinase
MTESWDRVKELVHQALKLDVTARRHLLDREDRTVREEVLDLLTAHDQTPAERIGEKTGDSIGRYRLQEILGEGGFGTVWRAEQVEPLQRQVALKVIKLGMDTKEVLARFEVERQALALMDHPHIARVLDAGATDQGRPYFVMELVRGLPITRYARERGLDLHQRLLLFQEVCLAVQHAHQKGIIHRDLKPSNVLVVEHEGGAIPKVIDFGIAKATTRKLTERTLFTDQGKALGTPEYMAPEQADPTGVDVDTRTDIYSLGILLYELLTGTQPFDRGALLRKGYAEFLRVIREVDPPRPSTRISTLEVSATASHPHRSGQQLSKLMRGELDWIVMKAIEKERQRRYDTASALAEDLRRYLTHEPLLAGPPQASYRLRKYIRRHRLGVVSGLLVTSALITGMVISTLSLWQANESRDQAETEAARSATVVQLLTDMLSSADPDEVKGPDYTVRQLLDDFDAQLGDRLAGEPAVQATVHSILGRAYANLSVFDKAQQHSEAALQDLGEIHGDDSDPLISALLQGAEIETLRGDYSSAMQLSDRAHQMWQRLRDEPDALLASVLTSKARTARHQGNLEQAETWCREALQLLRDCEAGDHATSPVLLTLGHVLHGRGKLEQAEDVFEQQHEMLRRSLGDQHPDTIAALTSVARILRVRDQYEEAEERFRTALATLRNLYRGPSQAVATIVDDLASTLEELGQLEEAEQLYREGLAMRRAIFGDRHEDVATILDNLSLLLLRRGLSDEALQMSREALSMRREAFSGDHAFVALSLDNLAFIHTQRTELDQAQHLYLEALEMRERLFGTEHRSIAVTALGLGWALLRLGRIDQAETYLRRAVDNTRQQPDEELALARRLVPLGLALMLQGKHAAAEPFMNECLEIGETFQPESWSTFNAMSMLGECLTGQGEFELAEPLLLDAYEGMTPPPEARANKRDAIERLVALYESWDKPKQAADWKQQLAQFDAAHASG